MPHTPTTPDPAAHAAASPPDRDIRSRDDVARVVDAFYRRAMRDEAIGFIFTDVARLDLEAHLPVMYDFWETVLLGARSYRGAAMPRHLELNRLTPLLPAHFERWLALWEATVGELYEGEVATSAIVTARTIARTMSARMEMARA